MAGNNCLTVVTCLFDLKSRNDNTPNIRGMDFYFEHGEWILSLNVNLVVWCDPKLAQRIIQRRKQCGFEKKTVVISIPFELLKYYSILKDKLASDKNSLQPARSGDLSEKIETNKFPDGGGVDNKETKKIKKVVAVNDDWRYIVMTWNKVYCMFQTLNIAPFKSTHYMWIDFGLFYVANPRKNFTTLRKICNDFPSKFRSMFIHDVSPTEIANRSIYYSTPRYKMAGGFYIAPYDIMVKFVNAFNIELNNMFKSGWYTLEENIFGVIYAENRSWFDPYYGDYENIIGSYFKCQSRVSTLFKNLTYCRSFNMHQISLKITEDMEKAYSEGLLNMNEHDVFGMYDEMFIAAFFTNNREKAKHAGEKIIEILNDGSEIVRGRIDSRLKKNLSLVGLTIDSKLELSSTNQ